MTGIERKVADLVTGVEIAPILGKPQTIFGPEFGTTPVKLQSPDSSAIGSKKQADGRARPVSTFKRKGANPAWIVEVDVIRASNTICKVLKRSTPNADSHRFQRIR